MNCVANGSHEDSELIPSVDYLLFHTEHDWTEILVVGKVVPVLRSIKVSLVRLLFDRRQFERSRTIELLLNRRFATLLQFANLR